MAFAIASLRASAPIEIDDVANVATSFPGFPALARAVGLALQELAHDLPRRDAPVPVVTIDGPSGSGKGTVSRLLAQRTRLAPARQRRAVSPGRPCGPWPGWPPTTSRATPGSRGRWTGRFASQTRTASERILLDGDDVTAALRAEAGGAGASRVAAWPALRAALLARQRHSPHPRV